MIHLMDAAEPQETLEARVYAMRLRQPWQRISRELHLPIPALQAMVARYMKARGGARTPESLLA